jgi:DNA-binding FadR family transcriptional regulator
MADRGSSRAAGGSEALPRVHRSIARDIGTTIVNGTRKPGDVLDSEIDASQALGISRSAYREAIRILVEKGLVESRRKAGTRVTQRHRWNLFDAEVLAWAFEGQPSDDFIVDLFELRGVIEPAAAAFAAQRCTYPDIHAMRRAIDDMRRFGLADTRGQSADQRFHRAILSATGNEALASLASSVATAVYWTTRFKQRTHGLLRDPLPPHDLVYRKIVDGDPDGARQAMAELLRFALMDMDLAEHRWKPVWERANHGSSTSVP